MFVSRVLLGLLCVAACAPPNQPDTVASPVIGVARSREATEAGYGDTYTKKADDGTVIAKVVAPVPAVWDAVLAALSKRQVNFTILNRSIGRAGDTAMVLRRQWNGNQLSRYLDCGSTMTGPRVDEERVRAILLAQLSKLPADTIAVAVHFSGTSEPLGSGNSAVTSQCRTKGQAEREILDDIMSDPAVRRGLSR
jgi:hypothetical protein